LLVVGSRLGDIPTRGYTTLEPPRTPQTLVHVHADADELGRVFEPNLPIVSGSPEFLAASERSSRGTCSTRRLDRVGSSRLHLGSAAQAGPASSTSAT